LLPGDVRTEGALGPRLVAGVAQFLWQIEHQGDRQAVELPRQGNKRTPRLWLDIGSVHNGQPSGGEPFGRDEV
jgi:hypothetical protein